MLTTEFEYDIRYVLGPDGENVRTRRITVTDPDPQPGCGPSLGVIHKALRESNPEEFGGMRHPEELQILSVRAPGEGITSA
jgi:hypothetical protein